LLLSVERTAALETGNTCLKAIRNGNTTAVGGGGGRAHRALRRRQRRRAVAPLTEAPTV
jgi:hypothetical protein